jgi:hypothetical protein
MLSVILQFLIAKFDTLPYIDKAFGLGAIVERQESDGVQTVIGVYSGTELVHPNFDNYKSLVYVMVNGNFTREPTEHPHIANLEMVTEVYPLRVIVYSQGLENVNCSSYSQSIAQGIKKNLTGLQSELREAINADLVVVKFTNSEFDKAVVWKSQTSLPNSLKDTDTLISIDFEISITGDEQCFAGEPCIANEFVFSNTAVSFCQMVNDCINSGEPYSLEISGTGVSYYSDSRLEGKELLLVATDGRIRKSTDYSFVSGTGTITFISNIVNGQKIYILYK